MTRSFNNAVEGVVKAIENARESELKALDNLTEGDLKAPDKTMEGDLEAPDNTAIPSPATHVILTLLKAGIVFCCCRLFFRFLPWAYRLRPNALEGGSVGSV